MANAAFLLLVDARLPTGSHAHSGGLEEAVGAGRVACMEDLGAWLRGRLSTVGVVESAVAVRCRTLAALGSVPAIADPRPGGGRWQAVEEQWTDIEAQWAARTPSPALRAAARVQGRGLLRAARACWPHALTDFPERWRTTGPAWPVALGAAGAVAGVAPAMVAAAAATAAVSGPAWSATRLLSVDPFAVASTLAGLAPAVDEVADAALAWADPGYSAPLPCPSAPLTDIGA